MKSINSKAKKVLILASSIFILLSGAQPIKAEEQNSNVKRFGIEAGIGGNTFLPFAQGKISYRLPLLDDKLDVFGAHSIGSGMGEYIQISMLGAKYYFLTNGLFQPYVGAGGGFAFTAGGVTSVSNIPFSPNFLGPLFIVGGGNDFMFLDNLGISIGVYTGYPIYFRPELNIKVIF